MKSKQKKIDPSKLPLAATLIKQSVADFGDSAMRIYGQKTNEDRSVPDVYDGCKPVQRRVLQGFVDSSARAKGPHVKTARVVGLVLGKYHPHGDKAVADAVETMVNSSTPLADGAGNWGDPLHGDSAASMRYTNCRLSRYSELVFFDPRMLAIATRVPNYDDKDTEIYVLPARLPNAIINGNMGIGVGITTDTPSFTVKSVISVLQHALEGWKNGTSQTLDEKACRKLRFNYPQFGGTADLERDLSEFKRLIRKGEGEITFGPQLEPQPSGKECVFTINQFGPDLNLEKALDKLREKPWFVRIEDKTGIENGSRPQYDITVKKADKSSWKAIADELNDLFSRSKNYKINLTVRTLTDKGQESIEIKRYGLVQFLNYWLSRRIELEKLALAREIEVNAHDARLTTVRILASANLDVIFKVLKSGKDFAGMAAELVKGLKIKPDEAEYILKMQVYRLSKLDGDEERKRLKELNKAGAELQEWLKKPHLSVRRDLDSLQKALVP